MSEKFKPLNRREEEEIIDYYYNPNLECTCNAIFADTHRGWCKRRVRPQEKFFGRNIQQIEDGHSKAKSSIPSGDISSVVSSSESCQNISEEDFVLGEKKVQANELGIGYIFFKEDIEKFLKLVKQDVDKNKLLEADFQSGEIEFSLTGELIPIEILNNIIKLRAGEELIQDG